MTPLNLCILFLLAVLWGGAFTLVGYAVDYFTPMELVSLRVALAAPVLWGVILLTGQKLVRNPRAWGGFFLLGIMNNALPFYFITWGQTRIDSGMAAVLNGATPLFGAVLAHILTRDEKLSIQKVIGLLIGLIGVVILVGPSLESDKAALMGQASVILGAACYAVAGVYGKRLGGYSPLMVSTGQLTMSSLLLIAITVAAGGFRTLPANPDVWISVAGLAIFSTALAYICYFHLIAKAGATNAMSVTLLVPVVAMLLGIVYLDEGVDMNAILATGLVLFGVGLVVLGGRKTAAPKPAAVSRNAD